MHTCIAIRRGDAESAPALEGSEGLFAALDFEPVSFVTWVLSAALLEPPPPSVVGTLQNFPSCTDSSSKEWSELLELINTSYRADDAFFVDQERTDANTLLDMASHGEFFTVRDDLSGTLCASVYLKTTVPSLVVPMSAVLESSEGTTGTPIVIAATNTPFSADSRGRQNEEGKAVKIRSINGPSCSAPLNTCIALSLTGGPTVTISMLTILPSLKRRGLATRLLKEIETRAREQGAVAIEAFVVSVKPWLFDFYEKHGFKLVGAEDWPPFLEWQLKKDCYFKQIRKILI